MPGVDDVPGQTLRRLGLRSTPQRRAILAAFQGGSSEHLSADEVHARAQQTHPELSRATVYATLAEFAELGVLGAVGSPEPVRYETNVERHDHFRCRVCLRHFDLDGPPRDAPAPSGFALERVVTRLDGVCAECVQYERGLAAGARSMREDDPAGVLDRPGLAFATADGPLGPLALAASASGVVRIAFEEHGDFEAIRERSGGRRGSAAAREHLRTTVAELGRFFAGELTRFSAPVDWSAFAAPLDELLLAAAGIPFGRRRSYADLGVGLPAGVIGRGYGANPVPLLVSCHRVTRGGVPPDAYVGGTERRRWLEHHERRAG